MKYFASLPLALIMATATPQTTLAADTGTDRHEAVSLDHLVDESLLPKLAFYFDRLLEEGEDLTLDDTKAFSGKDKFLPGKIAIAMSHLLLNTPRDDPDFERYLQGYRELADMTLDDTNESWGIYYYVSALYRLQQAGLLERAVRPETLEALKEEADWRQFVDEDDLTLIDLPTNYYGVAFSIARLRHLLGWEDTSASERLLDKMMAHYQEYSGEYGFSDETEGEGRFDRYSVLLIGEISQRFIETGLEVTPRMREWLRNAVDVVLVRLNKEGHGFSYGRSIGPYGDTAFLEVLSAAAHLDVLNDEEKAMAYAFATRATQRYVDFWYDEEMNSVNLWEKGRTTDDYRGKHRILGENLSLTHQHLYTAAIWDDLGMADERPTEDYAAWLDRLPRSTLTWFARGEYDRALITHRDGDRVISLPLINGGKSQHMNNPYYPIPFSNGMLEGTPDEDYPQLLPRFTLEDGDELIPAAFIEDVEYTEEGDTLQVKYRQSALDRLGKNRPKEDDRLSVETEYTFAPGAITRTDTYRTEDDSLEIDEIVMEFASFSEAAEVNDGQVTFGEGAVSGFSTEGFDECEAERVDGEPPYQTPVGPLMTRVSCERTDVTLEADDSLRLSWTLEYTPDRSE